MSDKNDSKGRPARKSRAEEQKAAGAAFDTWLERKLHEMFDSVTAEPLPDDLMKVIAELDKKTKEK